jgi:hypothetical protein
MAVWQSDSVAWDFPKVFKGRQRALDNSEGNLRPTFQIGKASCSRPCRAAMNKSALRNERDELQMQFDRILRQAGFKRRGRTYNRTTVDGLTHVMGVQMGSFDPPGTTYIPGLRENLYGRFAVNLGVYVPEVAREHGGGEAKNIVHDYNCSIRTRLGRRAEKEIWWRVSANENVAADITDRLQNEAFPLFQRLRCRDEILNEFLAESDNPPLVALPRIVCAIILLERGEREEAGRLLAAQARDHTRNPGHRAYVIMLAQRLGIEVAT